MSRTRLGDRFPFIRIISLPQRGDRREEIVNQLSSLNIRVDGYNVGFLEGQISQKAGSFASVSERGRFLAHLLAIGQAKRFNFSSLLLLEDDILFSSIDIEQMGRALDDLSLVNWDIFYGGSNSQSGGLDRITFLGSNATPEKVNFIALSRNAIEAAVPYFNTLAREESSGPSSTELAYAELRSIFTDLDSYRATPRIVRRSTSITNKQLDLSRNNVVSITQAREARQTKCSVPASGGPG